MAIRLVILDFDGTLADTRPLIIDSMQSTIRELQLPARSDAECRAMIGLPLKECFMRLLPIDDVVGDRCVEVYRRIFDEKNHNGVVKLFSHVMETLREMHERGLLLAICSSRGRPTLEGFVRSFHLESYVSMVVSANDVQYGKPHPEPVRLILQKLAVAADEAMVVGDASYDILMGCAAGCRTCGVTYGNQSAAELKAAGAELLIDDFAELTRILGL